MCFLSIRAFCPSVESTLQSIFKIGLKQVRLNMLLKEKKSTTICKSLLSQEKPFSGRKMGSHFLQLFPGGRVSPQLCVSSDCFMHLCLYLSCIPSLSSQRMENAVCFALSPEANIWESYKRNKGCVALFGHISHHLNVPTDHRPWQCSHRCATGTKHDISIKNTIKSCICFAWRSWLLDPSIWNSQREALNAWETQMKKKSNLSKKSNSSNGQHSHCFLCLCFPTHSANGETAPESHIKNFYMVIT